MRPASRDKVKQAVAMLRGAMNASTSRSRIHLIGGGPGAMLALRRHVKAVLAETQGPKKPLGAYVGAASGDNAAFQHMIGAVLVTAGARVRGVKLASARAKLSAATTLLEDCDVVFVSGGDVEAGMHVLQDRGILPLFHGLAAAGKPMIGISAGSIMLGRAWVRFPDEDASNEPGATKGEPTMFPCMGLAPVHVDAHAEDDDWAELKELLRLAAAAGEHEPVGYGLTRKGGVAIEPREDGAHLVAFGTPTPRFTARGGKVTALPPLAEGRSVALDKPPTRRGPSAR
jgi:cyanophycinase-like exopeptidase